MSIKTWYNYILSIRNIYKRQKLLTFNIIEDIPCKKLPERTKVIMLITDKIHFETKPVTRDKKKYTREPVLQQDIHINMHQTKEHQKT